MLGEDRGEERSGGEWREVRREKEGEGKREVSRGEKRREGEGRGEELSIQVLGGNQTALFPNAAESLAYLYGSKRRGWNTSFTSRPHYCNPHRNQS